MKTVQANGLSDVYSQDTYAGFELEWENRDGRDILLSAENEDGLISFQYDENNYRSVKTDGNGQKTFFEYDAQGKLQLVEKNGHLLEYVYDQEQNLTTIVIDGKEYQCLLDDSNVSQLFDEEGNLVVEYQYENNMVVGVYGVSLEGDLTDKSSDSEFIGNLNQVTYNSYYYDCETGWYYCGIYYDVVGERFVDGNSLTFEQALARANSMRAVSLESHANAMYEYAMSSYDFGKPMNQIHYDYDEGTSGPWYLYQSTMSIVARIIYGENPFSGTLHSERVAIGWTIWNRKVKNGFENTIESVVLEVDEYGNEQFAARNHSNTRNPITTSDEWASAVRVASYLFSAEYLSRSTSELKSCMPQPIGITDNHVFFVSYGTMVQRIDYYTYQNAVIAGYGSCGNSLTSLQSALNAYKTQTGYSLSDINIFFTATNYWD